MIVTIASGKGGTGKTTLAVNLALAAARIGHDVHLCDCDVEEPNAHLFLNPSWEKRMSVDLPLPVVDQDLCQHCGACARICEFNAIAALPRQTMVFPELCHSCGGCWLVCPHKAIDQGTRRLGRVESGSACGLTFTRGVLEVGQTQVPPVIQAVKALPGPEQLVFRDAPPGVTCPTVESLAGSDLVLLVTEPTPFGLHDLQAAVDLVRDMGLPHTVVVNRRGSGDDRVEKYCRREGIPLLAGVPYSRRAAEIISRGGLLIDEHRTIAGTLNRILDRLLVSLQEVTA